MKNTTTSTLYVIVYTSVHDPYDVDHLAEIHTNKDHADERAQILNRGDITWWHSILEVEPGDEFFLNSRRS